MKRSTAVAVAALLAVPALLAPSAAAAGLPATGTSCADVADGSDELELGDGEPGVPEERQAVRQREARAAPDRCDRAAVPLHRRGRVDRRGDAAPELGLPGQVRVNPVARPVAVAAERGESVIDLDGMVALTGLVPAADLVALFEEAEELARQGELLIGPADDDVARLRRWFVEELTAQLLEGRPPEPFPG